MYLYFIGLMIIGLMIVGLMIIGFKCDFYVEIQKVMKWLQIFFVLSFLIKKGEVNIQVRYFVRKIKLKKNMNDVLDVFFVDFILF